ncbi:unnamed protein product [Alternaria alternata]
MPAFRFRHIKELYPVFWGKSMEFCAVVKRDLGVQPDSVLDVCYYATRVTLDIIGIAGMGRDLGSLYNKDDELAKNYQEILEPTPEKVLKMKIRCEKAEGQESRDILSIMIRGNDQSDKNLVDQLLTFVAAGHETTSSALTWTSYLLAQHPAIQARLRSEILKYIPDPGVLSSPDFDVARLLESMPYLNCVCNEVLRLFPPVPLTSRVAVRDTTVCGHFIPSGTMFWIVPWAINRSPKLWGPDAEDFVPERWMDTTTGRATMNGGAESNYSFLTFLHGPRGCIGERFARAKMRSLVATFVGNFEMELADPNEEIVVGGTLTSKPRNGMKLRLKDVKWGP